MINSTNSNVEFNEKRQRCFKLKLHLFRFVVDLLYNKSTKIDQVEFELEQLGVELDSHRARCELVAVALMERRSISGRWRQWLLITSYHVS